MLGEEHKPAHIFLSGMEHIPIPEIIANLASF